MFVNKDASTITIAEESLPAKFFVNVTHCMELPAPLHDVDEDEAARLIDTDQKDGFKVPLSLGELYPVEDRRGEPAQKVISWSISRCIHSIRRCTTLKK